MSKFAKIPKILLKETISVDTEKFSVRIASLAKLVRHLTRNEAIVGSTPTGGIFALTGGKFFLSFNGEHRRGNGWNCQN